MSRLKQGEDRGVSAVLGYPISVSVVASDVAAVLLWSGRAAVPALLELPRGFCAGVQI